MLLFRRSSVVTAIKKYCNLATRCLEKGIYFNYFLLNLIGSTNIFVKEIRNIWIVDLLSSPFILRESYEFFIWKVKILREESYSIQMPDFSI